MYIALLQATVYLSYQSRRPVTQRSSTVEVLFLTLLLYFSADSIFRILVDHSSKSRLQSFDSFKDNEIELNVINLGLLHLCGSSTKAKIIYGDLWRSVEKVKVKKLSKYLIMQSSASFEQPSWKLLKSPLCSRVQLIPSCF